MTVFWLNQYDANVYAASCISRKTPVYNCGAGGKNLNKFLLSKPYTYKKKITLRTKTNRFDHLDWSNVYQRLFVEYFIF